jgi:OOP family OmpA-OmpF porin
MLPALLAMLMAISGCALQYVAQQPPPFQVQPLVKEMWKQKADNLVFILDASSSMAEPYYGPEKYTIGRAVVANFNQTMPELPYRVALRSFGHSLSYSYESTLPVYSLREYSREGVAAALDRIVPAGGPSPMEKSFVAAAEDLRAARGRIAMVVVSDGKDMDKAVLKSARALGKQYQKRLCIHTVLIGDDAGGRQLLADISAVTGCGTAIAAENVDTGAKMADFVADVLLEKAESWIFRDINFASDKADLLPSSYPTLETIFKILNDNQDLAVEIQGHTDSTASEAHNMDLSQRRAKTVMEYLVGKGIAASRLTAVGFGEARPVDSNATEAGKANNRRVELKPLR